MVVLGDLHACGGLMKRRTFLRLSAGAAVTPIASRYACALDYPTRPVHIIVGFPPGGPNDLYARLMAQWLSQRLGQQFIVENRPGAGATLGTEIVTKAPPDGYTLLLTFSGDAWNATLYDNLKFNFVRDIEPIASVSRGIGLLVANPSVPVKSVPELITYAKSNPGKITAASGGIGSSPHMYLELFKNLTGANILHVPYRGAGPAITDLLGGQVQIFFSPMVTAIGHVRAEKLRALAVTGGMRSESLPDIPTVGEFVPGYEATSWWGVAAPKNTPVEIVDKLSKEINAGLIESDIKSRIAELGDTVFPSSRTEFAKLIADDTEKWGKVIRAANIKAD
jgi:tripartite-type tricarboxylate transporter receptor subunit TctC